MSRRRVRRAPPAIRPAGGPPRHARSDQPGSERLAAWTNQTLVPEEAYAPFGEAYAGAGAGEQMFAGKGQRLAAGIYDFPFRHYSPAQGRWLSPDPSGLAAVNPADPQSWNAYAYVANQPPTATDPLGLCPGGCGGQQIGGGDPLTPSARCEVEGLPDNCWLDPGTISFAIIPSAGFGGGVTAGGVGRVGMQTERLPPEPIELAPTAGQCARPSFSDAVAVRLLGWVASWTGRTVGLGGGASAGIGAGAGATVSISRQLVVSPGGSAAWVTTLGGNAFPLGFTMGFGAIGGIQMSESSAANPEQLAGVSGDISLAGGVGDGAASFDYSAGAVSQVTLTGGVGGGAYGAAGGIGLTGVTPICGG